MGGNGHNSDGVAGLFPRRYLIVDVLLSRAALNDVFALGYRAVTYSIAHKQIAVARHDDGMFWCVPEDDHERTLVEVRGLRNCMTQVDDYHELLELWSETFVRLSALGFVLTTWDVGLTVLAETIPVAALADFHFGKGRERSSYDIRPHEAPVWRPDKAALHTQRVLLRCCSALAGLPCHV